MYIKLYLYAVKKNKHLLLTLVVFQREKEWWKSILLNVANRIFLFQMNRKEKETFTALFAFLTKDFSTPAFE